MKLKVIIAGLALGVALLLPSTMQAEGVGVAVIKTDGSTHHVELAAIERIDIASGALTIRHVSGSSSEHAYADIERMDIGVALSGIAGIVADGSVAVWPTSVRESVNVSGAPAGTRVTVYNIAGSAVASAVCGEGVLSVDLSALSAGAYIVSVGRQSVKIVKH